MTRLRRGGVVELPETLRHTWAGAGVKAVRWAGAEGGLCATPVTVDGLSRLRLRTALPLLLPSLAEPGVLGALGGTGPQGWALLIHALLARQMVRSSFASPLRRLMRDTIPADPFAPAFCLDAPGGAEETIGPGWREARLPGTRASLVFRADAVSRSILYVWLHSPPADWPPLVSGPVILFGAVSTIGAGGQVAVPEALCAQAGLLPGSALRIGDAGGVLHVSPAIHASSDPVLAVAACAAAVPAAPAPARTVSRQRLRIAPGAPRSERNGLRAFV